MKTQLTAEELFYLACLTESMADEINKFKMDNANAPSSVLGALNLEYNRLKELKQKFVNMENELEADA